MKKINNILLKFLLFDLPLVAVLMIWSFFMTLQHQTIFDHGKLPDVIALILAWNIIAWLIVLIFVLAELLIYHDFRSQFFAACARLAGVKERDERETQAIDRACRYAYISTLSLLVVILFFYSTVVTVSNIPPDKVVNGKHKALSIGFGIALTDESTKSNTTDPNRIFSSWNFPISKWSLIALIIAWHLISFLIYLRRANKFS
jgi:hypothetical protein